MAFNLADVLKNVPDLNTGRDQIEYIRLENIEEDPNNFYHLSGIEDLAANIELCGLQQPIRVRAIPEAEGKYRIVSGHRRRKAVELLAQENPQKWGEVPCIVETDAVSPNLQQLRLIYANANTRTMTSAEVSEQAVQVEKLLYQLKEEGYAFPGRMRDHVAQAVNTSKSKLARLKVIRDKLSEVWEPSWKKGDLGESSAYALAQIPKAYQNLLFEEKSRSNANIKYLYADDIKKFAERAAAIEKQTCSTTGGECENCERKLRKAAVTERYGWFHCDSKCCKDCPELIRCKASCPRLAETVKKLRADAKEAAKQEASAKEEKDKPVIDFIRSVYQRVGDARKQAGVSVESLYKAQQRFYSYSHDEPTQKAMEAGTAKISTDTWLPFGNCFTAGYARKLCAVADLLNVSIDYLLGRSEAMTTNTSELSADRTAPEFIAGNWYAADKVEPPMGVNLILIDSGGHADTGKYKGCGEYTMDFGDPVVLWTFMHQEKDIKIESPDAGSGWRSGEPEAYGTYAAYVRVADVDRLLLLKELLWDGEEWFMNGSSLSEHATVAYWMERPEV